jgi:hypothetical protein
MLKSIQECKDIFYALLSARKLDETIPEKNGWVDRNKLLDISGRGRKRQIELAGEFGVSLTILHPQADAF